MKKLNPSYLFYFVGILWLFAGMISENMRWGYALGFAFIALGIAMRIKKSIPENSKEETTIIRIIYCWNNFNNDFI